MSDKKKEIPTETADTAKSVEPVVDLTQARAERCKPVVLQLIKAMLDQGLLINDLAYMEAMVKLYMKGLFENIVVDHFQDILKMTNDSFKMSLDRGLETTFGKSREELTVQDLDDMLKGKYGKQDDNIQDQLKNKEAA